jgi:small glutamine-rich tetratricopeptide repeat-containing protein alpha
MSEQTLYLVLEHLATLKVNADADVIDKIDKATELIEAAFLIDAQSVETFDDHSYYPVTLTELINAGADKLDLKPVGESYGEVAGTDKFEVFVNKVAEKGFFHGVEEGSIEYRQREVKIAKKFQTVTAAAGPAKEEQQKLAEEKKNLGNACITSKDFESAIGHYAEAIQLSSDGPNTHVYYSNRAAALMNLKRFDDAIEDCESAIGLSPDYIKAHTRLAQATFFAKKYDDCVYACTRVLELEPDNKGNRDLMSKAQAKSDEENGITSTAPSSSSGSNGGMPDLSSLAGMMGGGGGGGGVPPGMAGMMNNPKMKQAMDQIGGQAGLAGLMKDPAMMSMAQNMMKNPDMMKQAMAMMGGGGGGGGMPDMSALAGMMGGGAPGGAPGSSSSGSSGKKAFKGFEE